MVLSKTERDARRVMRNICQMQYIFDHVHMFEGGGQHMKFVLTVLKFVSKESRTCQLQVGV